MSLREVSTHDLSVTLDGERIIDGISTRFKSTEVTCIVGPNAAGKSVFTKALSFLLPSEGEIRWDGEPIDKNRCLEQRRRSSYLPQSPYFFKGDVLYNLSIPLIVRGVSRRDSYSLVEKTLKDFNLSKLARQNPRKLSGGQRQKLGVIRAILPDPELLILDEPTSSIDSESKIWIEEQISSLKTEKNMCLIWITHDLLQAQRISDKVLVIEEGRLVIEGEFTAVLSHKYFDNIKNGLAALV